MKPFTKRLALVMGLLFTALICCGIVYIDTVKNYWSVSGGFVQLVVNTNAQASITVDTNLMFVGINTNNQLYSFLAQGRTPAATATGNGATAANSGSVRAVAGGGGDANTNSLAATGGAGGGIVSSAGTGGSAINTVSNSTGGAGGTLVFASGTGGGERAVATNAITGGAGGTLSFNSGAGGAPSFAASNTAGGNGGAMSFTAGAGGTPTAGTITQKGGTGGAITMTAGVGGGGSGQTNGANGGAVTLTAGAASSGTGNPPGNAGIFSLLGGAGSVGSTNSDGGNLYFLGGSPGSGAVPGYIAIGRNSTGTARGGLQVGPVVAGTTATLTNLLTITATLDFGSIAAGTIQDLPVAFAGAADGDVVTVAVPLSAVTNCTWMGFASNAVVYVRAANGQLGTAQDPNSGSFRIVLQKFR